MSKCSSLVWVELLNTGSWPCVIFGQPFCFETFRQNPFLSLFFTYFNIWTKLTYLEWMFELWTSIILSVMVVLTSISSTCSDVMIFSQAGWWFWWWTGWGWSCWGWGRRWGTGVVVGVAIDPNCTTLLPSYLHKFSLKLTWGLELWNIGRLNIYLDWWMDNVKSCINFGVFHK